MSLYRPFTVTLEKARLLFKKRNRDAMPAVLGSSDLPGARVDIPDMKGFVYARFPGTPDANGFVTYGAPMAVRSGTAAYPNYPGAEVYVAYNYSNELEIVGTNNRALDQAGVDTRVFNPLNQQSKFVYLWQIAIAFCSAVANSVNDSFLVTVKKFRHYTGNVFGTFETGTQADKVDLEPYVPATNMHCYAAVWIDLYDNVAEVVASTAQSLFIPLDETDIQECVDNAPGRPPDAVGLRLFYLANDQGKVTQQPTKDVDVRQFLNMPAIWGFPTNLTTRERVRPGYTLVTAPYTTSGNGALTVESGGRVVIKPVDNLSATTDPTVNDDINDGYTRDSVWINTVTPSWWVCLNPAAGAAVWQKMGTGNGTVTSVALSEDTDFLEVSGSPVTTAGTLALNRTDGLAANRVVATPDGTTGKVTTRALVEADIPALPSIQYVKTTVRLTNTVGLPSCTYANGTGGVGATLTATGTGALTFDGQTVALNDRILVMGQASALQNGIYLCTTAGAPGVSFVLTRATDSDTSAKIISQMVIARAGTANTSTLFYNTNTAAITIGTDAINYATTLAAGTGLAKSGSSISLSTPVGTASGGTGTSSATAHAMVTVASSGVAYAMLAPGTSRNVVISDGTDWTSRPLQQADLPKNMAVLVDSKAANTAGGTSSTTTWNARDLNTEQYDPSGIVTLSSNKFTPLAGDYVLLAFAPFLGGSAATANGRSRLYNVTGGAAVDEGVSMFALANQGTTSMVACGFTANGTDEYRIDTYTSVGRATNGLGLAVNDGAAETYTTVILWKLS